MARASADATADAESRPALTDAQLAEILELIRGADSVELKLTVPEEPGGRGYRSALGESGDRPARRPDPPGVLLRHA